MKYCYPVINHKHKFIWYLVPKAASRSIRKIFYDLDNEWLQEESLMPVDEDVYRDEVILHTHPGTHYFSWAIVRNPWSRLVSTWADKTKKCIGTPHARAWFKPYEDSTFTEFIYAVRDDKIKVVTGPENGFPDRHIIPQDNLIPDSVETICRIENLQQEFRDVCERIKIPYQYIPYHNKTDHKRYTEYYDDETAQIVAAIYRKDIERFGYKFGDP